MTNEGSSSHRLQIGILKPAQPRIDNSATMAHSIYHPGGGSPASTTCFTVIVLKCLSVLWSSNRPSIFIGLDTSNTDSSVGYSNNAVVIGFWLGYRLESLPWGPVCSSLGAIIHRQKIAADRGLCIICRICRCRVFLIRLVASLTLASPSLTFLSLPRIEPFGGLMQA
jgi:hypothetical protein